MIEEDFPFLADILCFAKESSFDIFSPLGKDLITTLRDEDDYDDTVDNTDGSHLSTKPPPGPDLEDAVAEEHPSGKHSPYFEPNGKQIYKACYLNQAFENYKKPGSTDQLKRVANVQCYAAKSTNVYDTVLDHNPSIGRECYTDGLTYCDTSPL
jgi:hypothetical protein